MFFAAFTDEILQLREIDIKKEIQSFTKKSIITRGDITKGLDFKLIQAILNY